MKRTRFESVIRFLVVEFGQGGLYDPAEHAGDLAQKLLEMSAAERALDSAATLEALEGMPLLFGTAPGRKIMVLATGTLTFSWTAFTGRFTAPKESDWGGMYRVLRDLADKGISIYPIDLRRLPYLKRSAESMLVLNAIADETGGKPCMGTNDLQRCFIEAVDDGSTYYSLGFYVNRANRKPGWQNVRIRVKRSGAEVFARKGYLWKSNNSPAAAK